MHIALLDTNTDDSAFGRSHPDEAQKFRVLMAPVAPDWAIDGFKVSAGEFPQALSDFDGIMISGSVASVNDPTPWIARLKDLIREAHATGIPVFGACFGHQAIAAALGGTVGPNPQGWVLGRYETSNHCPAPWMHDAGPTMTLHAAHKEQVLTLPPGATIHAGTPDVPHGLMSVGARVFSTQYHPELDTDFMHGLLDHMQGEVAPELLDSARSSLDGPVHDALMAEWIKAFFDQARTSADSLPPSVAD
ncbi:MAG: type 1 glutamine amidotransferase [Pararhodobacter sp.]